MTATTARTELRARISRAFAAFAAILVLATALVAVEFTFSPEQPEQAQAANAANFNPGMIISDAEFYNSNSMTVAEVQAFLNSKVSNCQAGYTCLKDFYQQTPSWGPNAYCNGYSGGVQTAAQIIVGVAKSCGINPKVLIVTLQKETSLITLNAPSPWRYERAMGYYCPDDPNNPGFCHPDYAGFFNQLYNASWQFQEYRANPTDYNYQAGRYNKIAYHPSSWQTGACPFANVYIQNQATAALYIYTPYVPNQTALADLYGGSSDGCSSYGNRNFWREYTDWFGSGASPYDPFGNLDSLTGGKFQISLSGWAADMDVPTRSLYMWVTIDGQGQHIYANKPRADIAANYPKYGQYHGFDATLSAKQGWHDVCVTASNIGQGKHTRFGCQRVFVDGESPVGDFTVKGGAKNISFEGWTVDRDGSDPRYIWITVDGQGQHWNVNQPRPDVQKAWPGSSLYTGFSGLLPVSGGKPEVCITLVNGGTGINKKLPCQTVSALGDQPVGHLDTATASDGRLHLTGWAADASDPSAQLYVWVAKLGLDGQHIRANTYRPDVEQRYTGIGEWHGFDATVPFPTSGTYTVCLTARNEGPGNNTLLYCKSVTAK